MTPVLVLFQHRPLNSRVQSRLSSFFASSGVIGRRSTKITLRPLYLSMPNNGSNCSELVSAVSAQSANIVLAVVGERCRRLLEAAFNSTNVCLMFAGQGLPVEQEPRARRTFVFGVPPLGALAGVATVLSRMQWHKAVVLTQNAVNDGDLRALGSANASLPPVVLELGSAGDTTLGVCSDDVLQKLLDALAEVKSRRTPLIVIDVYVEEKLGW